MANFYCEYCGQLFSSVASLTNYNCQRHPDGNGKGKHKLYKEAKSPNILVNIAGKNIRVYLH